jgi:hypothetical protein
MQGSEHVCWWLQAFGRDYVPSFAARLAVERCVHDVHWRGATNDTFIHDRVDYRCSNDDYVFTFHTSPVLLRRVRPFRCLRVIRHVANNHFVDDGKDHEYSSVL